VVDGLARRRSRDDKWNCVTSLARGQYFDVGSGGTAAAAGVPSAGTVCSLDRQSTLDRRSGLPVSPGRDIIIALATSISWFPAARYLNRK